MICTVHTKLNSGGNLTKLSYDKLVSVPLIQMQNMAFKIRASDIGKVSDNNVRICNRRLHIYFFVIPCNRMYCIWVWVFPVFHLDFLRKDTAQTKIPLKELEAQIAGLDFDIEQEKQQTYTFLSPDKIENYLNSVICSDIQEMPVRKPIVKTCVREVILDNDSVTITFLSAAFCASLLDTVATSLYCVSRGNKFLQSVKGRIIRLCDVERNADVAEGRCKRPTRRGFVDGVNRPAFLDSHIVPR